MKILEQNFTCSGCGRCCKAGWRAPVDAGRATAIRSSLSELRVIQAWGSSGLDDTDQGTLVVLRDQQCVYLGEGGLCDLHGELGSPAKPLHCQLFPLILVKCPDGVVAGASFYCPSVQANEGQPLAEQREWIERLAAEMPLPEVGDSVLVRGQFHLPWERYRELEAALLEPGPFFPRLERARTLVASAYLEGSWPEDWRARLENGTVANFPFLRYAFMAALVDRAERASGELAEAFREQRRLPLSSLQIEVSWAELLAAHQGLDWGWMAHEMERYFRALLFRKFLAFEPGLLENFLILDLLMAFLDFYTMARAYKEGRPPRRDDFEIAQRRCEWDLFTYGKQVYLTSSSYCDLFLQQFQSSQESETKA